MKKTLLLFAMLVSAATAWAETPTVDTPHYFINGRLVIKIAGDASGFVLETRATEDDEWTTVEGLTRSGDFLMTPTQEYSGVSCWRLGVSGEDPKWADFGTISARHPILSGIYSSNGQYNDNCTAPMAFDGNPDTYYEPGSAPYYVCMDFGEEREIVSIAYMPRNYFGDRVQNGWVECANSADFSDAWTICTLPNEIATRELHVIYLQKTTTARYVRFRTNQWMNIAEFEINEPGNEGADEYADLSKIGLKVGGIVVNDCYRPSFTWDPVNAPVTLQVATSSDGPWEVVDAIDPLSAAYVHESGPFGQLLYYRLVSGPFKSAIVSARHLRRIPTSNADIQWQGTQPWGDHPGSHAFDDDDSTFPDLSYNGGLPKLVVGFGDEGATNHIAIMRVLPRNDGTYYPHANGANLYGSTRAPADEIATDDLSTRLSLTSVSGVALSIWTEVACDATFCYPTYYIKGCESGNLAEVQFYGWFEDDHPTEQQPTVVKGLTVMPLDVETFKANITWAPLLGDVTIERSVNRGPWSDLAVIGGRDGVFVDHESFKPGTLLKYRMSNTEGTTAAISYRTMRRLSIDGGVTFANGSPYNENGTFDRAFDGDTNTRCDIYGVEGKDYGNIKLGIDFGEATNYVGCIRAYPRKDGSHERMTYMTLYGGMRDCEAEKALDKDGAVKLTQPLPSVQQNTWHLLMADDLSENAKPYRTYFVSDMTGGGGGNIAELEFYGWSKSDLVQGLMIFVR